MYDISILKNDIEYENIYLFASDKLDNEILNNIIIKKNDGIVLFNKPSDQLKKKLNNYEITYSFNRGYGVHLDENKTLKILNDKYNIDNCKFILCDEFNDNKIKKKYYYKNLTINNINLQNDIILNGYIPDKKDHYSPSLGFIAIYILNKIYPNSKIHLIGFTNINNRIIECHNYGYELTYINKLKNIINY
jgi:hypothetical protein